MKVLFAISNEEISESIVKKYQAEYKQIISSKSVYYFEAILKEIQKDKTYDRIVISEDLEAFAHSQYDQIDKFIFDKLDSISDEASNGKGADIPIILICTDRRMKGDQILVKLFGIGIYNALIGPERSIEEVCALLNRPRTKREAKEYYKIDAEDVNYMPESEDDVNEVEIQNILAHYKKLGKNEEKYVESFDNIAEQYNDKQLRVISKVLPLNVRAVLEEKSPKYQKVMSFNNMISDDLRRQSKEEDDGPVSKLLKSKEDSKILSQPVVIPSAMGEVQKLAKNKREVNIELIDRRKERREERRIIPPEEQHPITTSMASQRMENISPQQESKIESIDDVMDELGQIQPIHPESVSSVIPTPVSQAEPVQPVQPTNPFENTTPNEPITPVEPIAPVQPLDSFEQPQAMESVDPVAPVEEEQPKRRGRGRPRKYPIEDKTDKPKRGRGRPRKNPLPEEQPIVQPIENVDSIIQPQEPLNPFENTTPIEPIAPVEPANPFESSTPVEPVQPINPFESSASAEPVQPSDPFGSSAPAEPVQPVNPFEQSAPAEPVQPVNPFEQSAPAEPVQPVNPFEQSAPAEPVQPVNPFESSAPAEPVQPVNSFEQPAPVEPAKSIESVEPAQEVTPVEPVVPDQQPEQPSFEQMEESAENTIKTISAYGKLDEFDDETHNTFAYTGVSNNKNRNEYKNTVDFASILTADKKLVSFLGTSKNGTSFIVNNLAELASSMGIKTAILDTTTNRNSYYIYTKNEESLREVALGCFDSLVNKQPAGIMVNKNLTVFTSLPGDDEQVEMVDEVLETLIKNYSLILVDTDFNTPIGYFKQSQELYLVQSLDILTIQPLTAFLRKLKSKNVLDERKIRIVINKAVKVRGIQEKTIIGGMAYYTDPAMSYMTELFDRNTVKYITIPFEDDTYIRYLENIINCEITLKGYSKAFMQSLKELANMVYPLVPNGGQPTYNPPSAYGPGNRGGNFSQGMNNTLDQMKRNY